MRYTGVSVCVETNKIARLICGPYHLSSLCMSCRIEVLKWILLPAEKTGWDENKYASCFGDYDRGTTISGHVIGTPCARIHMWTSARTCAYAPLLS